MIKSDLIECRTTKEEHEKCMERRYALKRKEAVKSDIGMGSIHPSVDMDNILPLYCYYDEYKELVTVYKRVKMSLVVWNNVR